MNNRKNRFFLIVASLLVGAFGLGLASLLWAQQMGMPPDGGYTYPYGSYPPPGAGQTPMPYLGAPPYSSTPPSYLLYPSQSRYFQGMLMPPQLPQPGSSFYGPQPAPPSLLQSGQRTCGFTTPQTPSPFPSVAQPPSLTPVQGPWPGVGGSMAPQGMQQYTGGQSMNPSAVGTAIGLVGRQSDGARELSKGLEAASSRNKEKGSDATAPRPSFVPEPYSPIEASFNLAIFPGQLTPDLRQFGYSLFSNPISTFAPVEDIPVGPDYIMGPGDDMVIHHWGSMDGTFVQSVDRNGQINLPNVGPVKVWGLTFKDAGELIRQQLSRYYRGLQTSVTMGRLRTIRVYVVGEVCQPGSYTLSSLATVTNALFAAGGPVKLGSLRNVQLKRNHHTVGTLDLYDFLLRGDKTRDFRLEPGDTIFVPPVGSIAAISGEVMRPAIYEIGEKTRVSDLLGMAGGKTPRSYLKRVQVIRTKPNAEREVLDLDLTTAPPNNGDSMDIDLRNGDLVTVYPTDPRIYNTIRLAGAVKHPGQYEFKSDMRLSQLIRREVVLPEAYLERVEIARLKSDLTTEIIQVNLKQAWSGDKGQDLTLQPLDQVTLRSEYRNPWSVTLGGEVKRPGTYTVKQGERLSSLLKRAGGFTDKAYPKGAVFVRQTVQQMEREKLDQFTRAQQERMLSEASTISSGLGSVNKEEAAAQQSVLAQRLDQIQVLASKVTLGRVVIHLDEPEKLEGSQGDLVLEDGDSLNIPLKPASVMVVGSVRNPASVLYKESEDVQYYLNRAGGLSSGAAEKEMYLAKADGSAIVGFLRLRNIDPGDVIVVPPSIETKTRWLDVWKDLMSIAGQAALGVAAIAGIVALQ